MARRAMQSPVTLNGHCLFSLDLPSLKRARWSFFRTSKTIFKRILQNLVQIDYDNENDECDDDNGDNVDDYDDENYPKPDNYHGVIVKIYPIRTLLLGKKTRTNKSRQGLHPPQQATAV